MKKLFVLLAAFVLSVAASGQTSKPISAKTSNVLIERFEGGSVKVDLGYNIALNKESALKREWFVVRDEQSPAYFEGSAGVNVVYKSGERYASGQFLYQVGYLVKAREALSAIEVRVIVLDVFGSVLRTLSSTQIIDLPEDQQKYHEAIWRLYSESEASEAFASIAYVAQVRTKSGKVYEIDRPTVFDQVRKVTRKITEADLEPKHETAQK